MDPGGCEGSGQNMYPGSGGLLQAAAHSLSSLRWSRRESQASAQLLPPGITAQLCREIVHLSTDACPDACLPPALSSALGHAGSIPLPKLTSGETEADSRDVLVESCGKPKPQPGPQGWLSQTKGSSPVSCIRSGGSWKKEVSWLVPDPALPGELLGGENSPAMSLCCRAHSGGGYALPNSQGALPGCRDA